jgi:hypothetical protein
MTPLFKIQTSMQFNLADILTILSLLGVLVGVYVTLRRDQVRVSTIIQQHEEKLKELGLTVKEETNKRDIDNKELWTKLVSIESSQSRTNVFLEENLKSINRLLEIHDLSIKKIEDKFTEQEKNINEFYRTYELTKKER